MHRAKTFNKYSTAQNKYHWRILSEFWSRRHGASDLLPLRPESIICWGFCSLAQNSNKSEWMKGDSGKRAEERAKQGHAGTPIVKRFEESWTSVLELWEFCTHKKVQLKARRESKRRGLSRSQKEDERGFLLSLHWPWGSIDSCHLLRWVST